MKSTNLHYTFCGPEPEMILVLRPEWGYVSPETIKEWASETLFIEEGHLVAPEEFTLSQAIEIVHKHKFAKIKL